MKKRLLVSFVALAALALVAAPALGQSRSVKSANKAVRSSVRALNMRNVAAAHPEAPSALWTNDINAMGIAVQENGGGAFAASRVFVPGGFKDFTPTFSDQMQIEATATGVWTTDADHLTVLTGLPGIADAAVCADNTGKIHVINGTLDGISIYASHLVYTPTAPAGSKWSALAIPNTVADGNYYSQDSGCSFIGGKIYLYGGYGVTDMGCCVTANVQKLTWVYDPIAGTWADTGKKMVKGRLWMGYAANPTRAFAAGGTSDLVGFVPMADTETFTVAGGWKAMAALPIGRLAPGMGFLGSKLVVFGGGDTSFTLLGSTLGCSGGVGCGSGPWIDQVKTLNTPRWFTAWATGAGKVWDAGGSGSAGTSLTSSESTA